MQKVLEKGMQLNHSGKWYVRLLGRIVMIPPILKAKWVESRADK